MFCVKCGKKIDYESRFCKECEAEMSVESQTVVVELKQTAMPQAEPQPTVVKQAKDSDKKGFSLALTAIIMAPIVWIMGLVNFSLVQSCIFNLMNYAFDPGIVFDLVINSIYALSCIAASIVVLVFGVKAQKQQEANVQNGGIRYTAITVLSIISRVIAIIALVCYNQMLIDTVRMFFLSN